MSIPILIIIILSCVLLICIQISNSRKLDGEYDENSMYNEKENLGQGYSTPNNFTLEEFISGRNHVLKIEIVGRQVFMTLDHSFDGNIWSELRFLVSKSNKSDLVFKLKKMSIKFHGRNFSIIDHNGEHDAPKIDFDDLLEEVGTDKEQTYNSKNLLWRYRNYNFNNQIKSNIVNHKSIRERQLLNISNYLRE